MTNPIDLLLAAGRQTQPVIRTVTDVDVSGYVSTPGEALSGTACGTVTLSEDLAAARSLTIASATFMVDDGTTYQGSGWVKASTIDAGMVATLELLTGTSQANTTPGAQGTTTSLLANVSSPGSAYQYAQGNVTVPAGHTYARLLLTAATAAGPAIDVSWDDTGLRQVITT